MGLGEATRMDDSPDDPGISHAWDSLIAWGVRGRTQPWRLGVTAGQLSARLPLALLSLSLMSVVARAGFPPKSPGPHLRQ